MGRGQDWLQAETNMAEGMEDDYRKWYKYEEQLRAQPYPLNPLTGAATLEKSILYPAMVGADWEALEKNDGVFLNTC